LDEEVNRGGKMITIQNQGISCRGKTKYVIRVGNVFIAEFWHARKDGLGRRLLEASKAVEKNKWKTGDK